MNDKIRLEDRSRLSQAAFEELARDLARQTSMRQALQWLAEHDPPLKIEDMITQDEFSHDILVPYKDGHYIVYESS
jgi:hypothetical protein